MKFTEPLIKARLIKRYKRFLADVELFELDEETQQPKQMTIHTANTGSMTGCALPGSIVWISNSHNPKRKYRYSWELSSSQEAGSKESHLIGINTLLANKLVKEAIEKGFIAELNDVQKIETEVAYGTEKSRIDLLVTQNNGQKCYVEVKNVTASFEPGFAAFPDAVTARGTKHLRELALMVQEGHRGILLFCVQREDIKQVRAAAEIDPLYAKTLAQVQENGVEVLAYGVHFSGDTTPSEINLTTKLSVSNHL
ncbi:MAG: DNA/RNA nuclease SfsA [gamma proteobacterium symbiont of Bathyaustriella thionipta]|nr:DNA/RNA nuclease SfsA [gamma proteobacterium symbiont of Bathyaustriella thionipta]MCU7950045.1 DNA/RNA nuclease SfsA [gamma proteobacterium symbiont of Bathyaustriella thionipta]MCU7954287.1 DNA/RNA nuclease SfsA [gamma proteobacterium symbiont of Bathyaustriella thionipta]MCU7956634.1 DNA/RNA nuclease SfsA [gamma proteobacterium symbiont of Bathyaustriella thionipta]MCU7969027.1 DNA/RNA nuclease SfsA [gamma proteobacterium symbiont of Bathyaustriella thionipta]